MKSIIDFIVHIDKHLLAIINDFGVFSYAILFLIIFAETGLVVTPFLPGDSLLFAAGALAAKGGFQIITLYAVLMVAAVVGDSSNYWIGRKLGVKAFRKIPLFSEEHLESTKKYFKEHGKKTVILGRFMPIIRTFSPFVAGIGHMEYREFLLYSIFGSFIWITLFTFAGYFFGNIPAVKENFTIAIMAVIVISFLPALYHYLKERKAHEARKKSSK